MKRAPHRQITIDGMDPIHGEFHIECDEKIAPLVRELNELGARTRYSCQGGREPNSSDVPYITIDREDETEEVKNAIRRFWNRHDHIDRFRFSDQIAYYAMPKKLKLRSLPTDNKSISIVDESESSDGDRLQEDTP